MVVDNRLSKEREIDKLISAVLEKMLNTREWFGFTAFIPRFHSQAQKWRNVLCWSPDEVSFLQLWALLQAEEGLQGGTVCCFWRQAL